MTKSKADEPVVLVGRLALRHEGNSWNAYYALPDSMEGAIFLASINMGAVTTNRRRKEEFVAMCRSIVGDILKDATGQNISRWQDPVTAPEHERAGHG